MGRLVRYADDMVVISKNRKDADRAMELLRYVMWKLDLTLHPTKTRLVSMWSGKEGFDFLGMHHQRHRKEGKGKTYYTTEQYPGRKARKRMREAIKHTIRRRERISWKMEDLIQELNPKIIGWRNYYGVQTARKCLNGLVRHRDICEMGQPEKAEEKPHEQHGKYP